jgi:hypothetical protein
MTLRVNLNIRAGKSGRIVYRVFSEFPNLLFYFQNLRMEFMTWMIFWIAVATFLSWCVIHKEMKKLQQENDILRKINLEKYEKELENREK